MTTIPSLPPLPSLPSLPVRRDSLPAFTIPEIPLKPPNYSIKEVPNYSIKEVNMSAGNAYHPQLAQVRKDLEALTIHPDTSRPPSPTHIFTAPYLYKESFEKLYQFHKSGLLCDVEIKIGSKSFTCHKAVLACQSQYFSAMFLSEMSESHLNSVTIQDKEVDEEAFEQLINFAYLAKITLTVDNVQRLLYAAMILQMESVAGACCRFMKSHLHPSNCIAVRSFAEQHNRVELIKIADQYMLDTFVEVAENDDFCSMSEKILSRLLTSPDLNVDNEAQVYEAIIKWVKHDLTERGKCLTKFMEKVKLPLLAPTYLLENVESEDLMRKNLECRDFLDEAKHYQMSLVSLVPDLKLTERTRPRKSYAGVLFCVGGRGSSGDPFRTMECYDLRKDIWFQVTDMNFRRRHVGVCSAGGLVYAVGGHDGRDHLKSGEVYDPLSNKWSSIAPMSVPKRGIALACLGGPIYAVGGLDDTECFNDVERFDPVCGMWTSVAAMNCTRGGVGLVALKGHLYALGGNNGTSSLDTCERYDPFVNKWTTIADMKTRRAGAGIAVLNGYIYVVGGFDDNAPLDSVERYDPKSNTWTPETRMTCCRGGVGLAALGGKLYAVGGHDGTHYLGSVEAFDPSLNSWETVSSIEQCRAGAGVVYAECPASNVCQLTIETTPAIM